jgi:tetratricopeptide (TPR) repeat protein
MSAFIRRDGHIVRTNEAEAWIEEADKALREGDEELALTLAFKALSWFQTAGASTDSEHGLAVCCTGEGVSLAHIAGVHAERKNWKEAAKYFEQSRAAFINAWQYEEQAEMGGNAGENASVTVLNLALAYAHLEKYDKTLELADEALGYFQETEDLDRQIEALRLAAWANVDLGRKSAAVERLKSAAQLARKMGNGDLEKTILESLKGVSRK